MAGRFLYLSNGRHILREDIIAVTRFNPTKWVCEPKASPDFIPAILIIDYDRRHNFKLLEAYEDHDVCEYEYNKIKSWIEKKKPSLYDRCPGKYE